MRRDRTSIFRGRPLNLPFGNHICNLIEMVTKRRGENAEEKVEKALAALQAASIIAAYVRIPQYGREQRWGIDFRVTTLGGNTIPFQVKSGKEGAMNHREHYPNVPVIIVRPELCQQELQRLLCQELPLYQTSA